MKHFLLFLSLFFQSSQQLAYLLSRPISALLILVMCFWSNSYHFCFFCNVNASPVPSFLPDALMKLTVSQASSTRFRIRWMLSAYCFLRFSKCSSADLLSGCVSRIRPALISCGVKLSMWLADDINPSASRLLGALPDATFLAVCAERCEKLDRPCAFSWKFDSRLGVPSGASTASVNCLRGVVMSICARRDERGDKKRERATSK